MTVHKGRSPIATFSCQLCTFFVRKGSNQSSSGGKYKHDRFTSNVSCKTIKKPSKSYGA